MSPDGAEGFEMDDGEAVDDHGESKLDGVVVIDWNKRQVLAGLGEAGSGAKARKRVWRSIWRLW